jgi:N-methylhydantoinase B
LDPITATLIGNQIQSVSEEMGVTLMRTAYSPNIKERLDYSTAIFDRQGQVIAQAQRIPIHLGSMLGVEEALLERHPLESIEEGDMFLANDPYGGGGTHLPDFNVIAPVFWEGEIRAFVANVAHHSDVGGMVVGSESGDCRDIYQEGLRLPLVRLVRRDEIVRDIQDIILANSRVPRDRIGDIAAQIASNRVGVRRMAQLYQRHGTGTMQAAMVSQLSHAEKRIKNAIAAIPDGVYSVTDQLDSDGVTERPVGLQLAMTCKGDRLMFDFDGSAPQVPSARNVPFNALRATIYALVKMMVDPDIPSNAGYYRAIDISAPAGSILNPRPPAATGVRTLSCFIVGDMVAHAISRATPARGMASSAANTQIILSGMAPESGDLFVDYESFGGGLGARARGDGNDAVKAHVGGSSNLPVESVEINFPMRIARYELLKNSGGPGQYRGGLGVRRDYVVLTDVAEVVVFGERQRNPPPGLAGGRPGCRGRFILNPGRADETELPTMKSGIPLRRGDCLRVETPGGGGWGNPLERDRELVISDVREERVSREQAWSEYGVEVHDDLVHREAATQCEKR